MFLLQWTAVANRMGRGHKSLWDVDSPPAAPVESAEIEMVNGKFITAKETVAIRLSVVFFTENDTSESLQSLISSYAMWAVLFPCIKTNSNQEIEWVNEIQFVYFFENPICVVNDG